jgi:hypothetical protein
MRFLLSAACRDVEFSEQLARGPGRFRDRLVRRASRTCTCTAQIRARQFRLPTHSVRGDPAAYDKWGSAYAYYVGTEGSENFIIVGRDYHNDGAGPDWLTKGAHHERYRSSATCE